MDATTRKQKLIELKANQNNIAMTGIPLRYRGGTRIEDVYRIPLDFLIYNTMAALDRLFYRMKNKTAN